MVADLSVMPTLTQLKLGGPLFLVGVIVAHAKWNSTVDCVGAEPPKIQSVMQFCRYHASESKRELRKRSAVAAMSIVSGLFLKAGVRLPAGVCPRGTSCVAKLPAWLRCLAATVPAEALQILADSLHTVSVTLLTTVEIEFNAGVRAASLPDLAELAPGELASRLHKLCLDLCRKPVECVPAALAPQVSRGGFYYIAAGVGCGIAEIQEVCESAWCV